MSDDADDRRAGRERHAHARLRAEPQPDRFRLRVRARCRDGAGLPVVVDRRPPPRHDPHDRRRRRVDRVEVWRVPLAGVAAVLLREPPGLSSARSNSTTAPRCSACWRNRPWCRAIPRSPTSAGGERSRPTDPEQRHDRRRRAVRRASTATIFGRPVLPAVAEGAVPFWRLVLRGCSQCCFQTNEVTGLIFLIAVLTYSWEQALLMADGRRDRAGRSPCCCAVTGSCSSSACSDSTRV